MTFKRKLHDLRVYISNVIKPHMTNGMSVTSLSASLLLNISVVMDWLCQIMLNWKLSS